MEENNILVVSVLVFLYLIMFLIAICVVKNINQIQQTYSMSAVE